MDKQVRGTIERATQRARALLETDFSEQLEGTYDVLRSGEIPADGGKHLSETELLVREKLIATVHHKRAAGMKAAQAVADYLRDAAFTTLNRFVALKMLEARELVQECVSKGEQSSGYAREFVGAAPGLTVLADGRGYRLYLESVFDELSQEVRVLFDRRDPASLLWPRRQTLADLLEILNDPELGGVWKEDETIGWVYQYFNTGEERREMRGESQAPRNSRELAVRNQFFTPRYVVEFLVDNTLGRMWYEMRAGNTRLAEQCVYMVRRPDETYPPRRLKDPRHLKILDPACGSGHFLLYAFELLEQIYLEAWQSGGMPDVYRSEEELRRALPGLILERNLHGIDIDPRCAQIAALSLWMRAQRAYQEAGGPRQDRPPITRTNIVVAEPMPGDKALVDEFAASLQPAVLGELFKTIVSKMELAGELGSLLKIEEELAGAVAALDQSTRQGGLFDAGTRAGVDFWTDAEGKLLAALEAYVAKAEASDGTARRLFANDARQGVAFVHLLRQKYNVVLMNPPFGAGSAIAKTTFERAFPRTKNDVYSAMVERGLWLLEPRGRLGAITSRTGFFLSSFQKWREEILLNGVSPVVFADLGAGVLDSALVETAAYCLETQS